MFKSMPCLIAAIVVFATSMAAPSFAAPPQEVMAPVKEQLSKKIDVQLLETPLDRVLELLQRESGLTVMIDPEARTAGQEDYPISLEARQMPIQEVLDWACRSSGLDWDVVNKVIVVSTPYEIKKRYLETKMYDIRSLLVIVQNFKGQNIDLDRALSNTGAGGSGGRTSNSAGGGGGQGGLFDDGDDDETEDSATRQQKVEQILELIRASIGAPEDWEFFGGELYSVRYVGDNMIVRTIPEHHEDINKMLHAIEKSGGKMVSVQARFIAIKTEQLDKALAELGGDTVMNAEQAAAFSKKITGLGLGAKTLGIGRTSCFNAQRVFVSAISSKIFSSESTPVPDTTGFAITQSTVRSGAVIDVLPTLTLDGEMITIAIRSDVVTERKMSEREQKAVGVVSGGDTELQTDVTLQQPEQDMVTHRTTVRIPNGGAVLLSGTSHLLNVNDKEDIEVVMLLTAKGVE